MSSVPYYSKFEADVKTLEKINEQLVTPNNRLTNLEATQVTSFKTYQLKSELPATGVANTGYVVFNDTIVGNNGTYLWDGSSYQKKSEQIDRTFIATDPSTVTAPVAGQVILGTYLGRLWMKDENDLVVWSATRQDDAGCYYDADATTGKVTIPTQIFVDGEKWSVAVKGLFTTSNNSGFLIGGTTTKNLFLKSSSASPPLNLGFRSSTGAYYTFNKLFSEVDNILTDFLFICDGTIISLYINGVFDSSLTPDFTDLIIYNFIKGYSNDTLGCSGQIYKAQIFNFDLTAQEVLDLYNGVAIDDKYLKADNVNIIVNGGFDADTNWNKETGWSISGGLAVANNTNNWFYQAHQNLQGLKVMVIADIIVTSGSVKAQVYNTTGVSRSTSDTFIDIIDVNLVTGGNFGLVLFKGTNFTGTIDNVKLIILGNTLNLSKNKGQKTWLDESGNGNHAQITGATLKGLPYGQAQKQVTDSFTTDISAVAKVLVQPAGYYIDEITIEDLGTTAGLSVISATQETSGDVLITGKSVGTGLSRSFKTISDHNVYDVDKNISFLATGNSALGMKISVTFKK